MPLTDEQTQLVSILQSATLVIDAQTTGITRMIGDVDNIPFVPISAAESAPIFAAIGAVYKARIAAIQAISDAT